MRRLALLLMVIVLTAAPRALMAQYFGQNKVQYTKFDFHVLETEHFDVYYYDGERPAPRAPESAVWPCAASQAAG